MYENVTFDVVLKRMLDAVPDGIDKREGSIIYNALAPAAVEIQNMYIQLDTVLNETFADTASRVYLMKRASEHGITPKPASKSTLRGLFNIDVPIGSRFSLDVLNYVVTEKIDDGEFRLECETAGIIGNQYLGTLIPINYIDGLTSAELTEVLIAGEDEEDTESLRGRYFDSLESQAFGGNVADYKNKTKALPYVGGAKVYPAWNGGGTVKIRIISSDFGPVNSSISDDVQNALDPAPGSGFGLAPIGHIVTVESALSTTVNIVATIAYLSGWNWLAVKPYAEATIDAYFVELIKTWEDTEYLVVRISQIESRLLDLEGIIDVSITINGSGSNLVLDETIPVRGTVSG